VLKQALAVFEIRGCLRQPNRSLDCFDLAEEGTEAAKRVMSPVLQEACRFGRDVPLIGMRQGPPGIHIGAHFINDRSWIVLLTLRRQSLPFVKYDLLLDNTLALLRFWDRGDELGAPTSLNDSLCRLPILIELPVIVVEAGLGPYDTPRMQSSLPGPTRFQGLLRVFEIHLSE